MNEVIINILPATSIILLLLFIIFLQFRSRRALERELSLSANRPPGEDITLIKEQALREIEELKKLELERLEIEMSSKRRENDEEIIKKQKLIDNLLEDYKKSKSETIAAELKQQQLNNQTTLDKQMEESNLILLDYQEHILFTEAQIETLRRTQESITDSLSRKALESEQFNLNISDSDALEIEDLRAVASRYGRIRPIILKAVYEIYYAPEVKKLVNRVIGNERVSGIYRITCKVDGRVYIGKSVDIRERWITHFKRAAGIESETQNLLYPAMRAIGLEQFSFEVIERDVPESMLTTREKYWQSFYDAKGHGFSVR